MLFDQRSGRVIGEWVVSGGSNRALCCLSLCAAEQVALDQGSWHLAWRMTLKAEPAYSVIAQHKPNPDAMMPHCRIAEESWVASHLAFLRDADLVRLGDGEAPEIPETFQSCRRGKVKERGKSEAKAGTQKMNPPPTIQGSQLCSGWEVAECMLHQILAAPGNLESFARTSLQPATQDQQTSSKRKEPPLWPMPLLHSPPRPKLRSSRRAQRAREWAAAWTMTTAQIIVLNFLLLKSPNICPVHARLGAPADEGQRMVHARLLRQSVEWCRLPRGECGDLGRAEERLKQANDQVQ